jgi:hypothetical protein
MDIATLRTLLLWSTVINLALLILWAVLAILARDWMCSLCSKLFRVSTAQVDQLNFYGISIYKLGIILFNLVPYLALLIVAK